MKIKKMILEGMLIIICVLLMGCGKKDKEDISYEEISQEEEKEIVNEEVVSK